jgi:hypothetical protein
MGGDGVSMPTVLSQLGNVAKTVAKNQQAASTSAGTLAPSDKKELQDLKKIPEVQKPENRTLERRRKDTSSGNKDRQGQGEQSMDANPPESDDGQRQVTDAEPGIGNFIDRMA